MLGVILSGGQSTRMGSDKGLLDVGGRKWAVAAADKLAAACGIPVAISVNNEQQNIYSEAKIGYSLIVDDGRLNVKGPLLGILSAHAAKPLEDLFILACDMPLMDAAILQELKNIYGANQADAFLFRNGDEYEPLCAIYTANGLSRLLSMQTTNQLQKYSMKYALEQIDCYSVLVSENQKKHFTNINDASELKGF